MSEYVTDISELSKLEIAILLAVIDRICGDLANDIEHPLPTLDPALFVQVFGVEEYQRRIDSAEDWFEWLWKQGLLVCDIDTPEGKSEMIHGMLSRVVLVDDRITQLGYIHKLSARTGIPVMVILAEANRIRR